MFSRLSDITLVCALIMIAAALIRMARFRGQPEKSRAPFAKKERAVVLTLFAFAAMVAVLSFTSLLSLDAAERIATLIVVASTTLTTIRFLR